MTNLIVLFSIPILSFYVIFYFIKGELFFSSVYLYLSAIFATSIILNKLNKQKAARLIIIITCAITVSFSIVSFGKDSQSQMFLCLLVVFCFIFFKSWISWIISILVIFSSFVFAFYYVNNFGPIAPDLRYKYDDYTNFSVALLCCLYFSSLIYNSINNHFIEISSKNQALKDKNEELEKNRLLIESQKNELELFTSMVSHDLKTPVRTINAFVDLSKKNIETRDNEKLIKYLDFIHAGSKQLDKLISGISDYKKLDNTETKSDVIDLNALIKHLIDSYNVLNPSINWQVDTLQKLNANESHMTHLFQNLIDNAIKYNESEIKEITITSTFKGDKYVIAVKDNGIGVDEKYKAYIFEPFKKLHPNHVYDSTGLGLSICKKIVALYNATIVCKPNDHQGSIFEISFPKERCAS